MTLSAFLSAVLALLLAPGPTNTLLGLAGAQAGWRRALRLIPAELSGYLLVVVPLAFAGAGLMQNWPQAAVLLKLAAGTWVMFLAIRLWRLPGPGEGQPQVGFRRVFVTTVLNPKALIFGLVLLPAPAADGFAPRLALFCLTIVAVATVWSMAGSLLAGGAGGRLQVLQRLASGWLAVVSLTLIAGVLQS